MQLVRVEVRRTPAALVIASHEHLDELLRELTLIRQGRGSGLAVGDHPVTLLRLMEELIVGYAGARQSIRLQAERCLAAGKQMVDIVLELPREAADAADHLRHLLSAVQDYSRRGALLTLPPDPILDAFQEQLLEEVARQLRDGPPPRDHPFDLPAPAAPRAPAAPLRPGTDERVHGGERVVEHRAVLDPSPRAVAQARRLVRAWLGSRPIADDAALLASELVTNAVLHGNGPIEFALRRGGHRVRLEVSDGGPPLPALFHRDLDAGTGRGLLILQALGARWGVEPSGDGGKRVWVELDDGVDMPSVRG